MGVTLYRPGNTRKINGIKCDMRTFDEYSYLHNLETGWFYSPEECYAEKENEEITPTEEEAKEETETKEADGLLSVESEPEEKADDDTRKLAKEMGIKNWYNKGIDKLKAEIEACQPEI